MSFLRPLGNTGLQVSALGLGTVKFGRNTGVKYPAAFALPDDNTIRHLLAVAHELKINVLDTAPAYGNSEERIGQLLTNRKDWVLVTKVGEEFDGTQSTFDFSAAHTRVSIERSLQRLRTDYLDLVLIHSNGDDEKILQESGCIQRLRDMKKDGLIRAIGMSTKTDAGGVLAAKLLDVVMVTYNLQQQDHAVIKQAKKLGKGVLIKKGLMSGHVQTASSATLINQVEESIRFVQSNPDIHCIIVGTLSETNLRSNTAISMTVTGSSS